ncbi:HNH endonuclease [Bacillus megaterium]|nr:HNH endonuclease [Priestia megaterium]
MVGEECHIISAKKNGPRYDSSFPTERLDSYENLILLCRIHHKLIDDQYQTYDTELLHRLKSNHEKWISDNLRIDKEKEDKPIRLKRNIPEQLSRITSGKELFNIIDGAMGYAFDHEETKDDKELEGIIEFLETLKDYGELSSEMEYSEQTKASNALDELLIEIEKNNFWVFGAQEISLIEGGALPPEQWPLAHIQVIRSTNSAIQLVATNK